MQHNKPLRVLHVVGGMNRGGVETWLMHVLRHLDRRYIHMDFLTHTTIPCEYDLEILELGGKILPCMHPSNPAKYAINFKRIVREFGPYDVIHSHVHHYSGYILHLAHNEGIETRIAHSHNDISGIQASSRAWRWIYVKLMERWINQYATVGLACSGKAAKALFGANWELDARWKILNYGIDLAPFKEAVDSAAIRSEFNIPSDAFVIGHVGRFAEQKNHDFLIDIIAETATTEAKIFALLIGDGPLRATIERKVVRLGLNQKVIFAGLRPDIPRVMKGAMDVFVFPSIFEGLGLVLIEAQSAGLPCIISDVVPQEADVIRPLIQRLPLSKPSSVWSKAILSTRDEHPVISQHDALSIIENSAFNIQASARCLQEIYFS